MSGAVSNLNDILFRQKKRRNIDNIFFFILKKMFTPISGSRIVNDSIAATLTLKFWSLISLIYESIYREAYLDLQISWENF